MLMFELSGRYHCSVSRSSSTYLCQLSAGAFDGDDPRVDLDLDILRNGEVQVFVDLEHLDGVTDLVIVGWIKRILFRLVTALAKSRWVH